MTDQLARDPSLAGLSAYHDRITGDILATIKEQAK